MDSIAVVVVGLHERNASLDLLERLAISEADLPKALQALGDSPHLSEVVVLSTCMRTEIYAVAERFHDGLGDIQSFLESRLGPGIAQEDRLDERLVVNYDEAAVRHLFEVAAGADSAVLGEGEILRQVRHAAERAHLERASGPVLAGLFRQAVEVGKRARTETGIARGITSLAHVAVAIAAEHFGDTLSSRRLVVVGAGEMGETIIEALAKLEQGPQVVIANRSLRRAEVLAKTVDGSAASLDDLAMVLEQADCLITATAADDVLIELDELRAVMASRVDQPLLIVDAAMPRDVDPAIGELEGVTLLDVVSLRAYAQQQMGSRERELDRVAEIITEELERYEVNARARSVAPVISTLRAKAEQTRAEETDRYRARLRGLDAETQEAVEALTRGIVAKLLHEPTIRLKEAAGTSRGERLAESLRSLFDL